MQWVRQNEARAIVSAQHIAQNIRRRVLDYVIRNNGGYLSQACSSAEILATLYARDEFGAFACANTAPPLSRRSLRAQ